MTKFFSTLATATALTLAIASHAQAGTVPLETGGVLIATQTHHGGIAATLIFNAGSVVSVSPLQLLVSGDVFPCHPDATNPWAAGDCFEAITPDAEVLRFSTERTTVGTLFIEGYDHGGAGVITVERVRTMNNVSCMPSTADGCQFDHFTLIAD